MSQFKIHNHQNKEYTLISNSFVDRFLAEANDVQIKVYLYLLRHANDCDECSIASMADFFNYSEKDILRALSYWEKKDILQLAFNENGELNSLCFSTPKSCNSQTPIVKPIEAKSESQGFVKTVTYLPGSVSLTKPDYTLDQLAAFKAKESTSEIMFIAESYLGRTLTANDVRSLLFISDELHFSFDLLDYLLQYCIDRGKKDFRYIEKVAISWAQANVTTIEQAQNHSSKYDKDTYMVMNALGKNNQPTPKEAEFIRRWYQVYGFTSDVILEACERTVLATDKHRFEYADKILKNWKALGIHHKNDISKADAAFEATKKKVGSNGSTPTSGGSTANGIKNKFNQFEQNDYDFEALEKELLSN
ncbi:MAG: DnaD domain protein [Lachnospiraceae bacterium]|nr:DnaD domain protein [Lachnospiraceae bacterium]